MESSLDDVNSTHVHVHCAGVEQSPGLHIRFRRTATHRLIVEIIYVASMSIDLLRVVSAVHSDPDE
jgi:hypothetical protein